MQVKICGITRPGDAKEAVAAGAHSIGLVFYAASKRAVSVAQAREICQGLSPFTCITALMVNPQPALVEQVLSELPVNLLQWHGDESPAFCEQWRMPYIRALRAEPGVDLVAEAARYPSARGFLVDAVHEGQFGGTGKTFDWRLLPEAFDRPLILAGGLDVDNVAEGIRQLNPTAVDVSSGVESAPGIKDAEKVQRFINAARTAAEGKSS